MSDSIEPSTLVLSAKHSELLRALAQHLHTQDNLGTANPIFGVIQQRYVYHQGANIDDGNWHWVSDEGDIVSTDDVWEYLLEQTPSIASGSLPLSELEDAVSPDYTRVSYTQVEDFVTPCFTRQAAQDYIDGNKHNLTKPSIFVYSAYRNPEWQALRNLLLSLPLTTPELEGDLLVKQRLLSLPEHILRENFRGRHPKPRMYDYWDLNTHMRALSGAELTHVTAKDGTPLSDFFHRIFGASSSKIDDIAGIQHGWDLTLREHDIAVMQQIRDDIAKQSKSQ
jgi:hypothetical protein